MKAIMDFPPKQLELIISDDHKGAVTPSNLDLVKAITYLDVMALNKAVNEGANPNLILSYFVIPDMNQSPLSAVLMIVNHNLFNHKELPMIKKKAAEVCDYLVALPLDLSIADRYGNTVLHNACKLKEVNLVKALIGKGGNVNALNDHQQPPLLKALEFLNEETEADGLEICRRLLQAGASIDCKDSYGSSLMEIAQNHLSKEGLEGLAALTEAANIKRHLSKNAGIPLSNHRKMAL